MDFFVGMVFGALIMAIAIAVSITYDPDGRIAEYRVMLGLEDEDEEQR